MSTETTSNKNHFIFVKAVADKASEFATKLLVTDENSPVEQGLIDAKANEIKADAALAEPKTVEGQLAAEAGLNAVNEYLASFKKGKKGAGVGKPGVVDAGVAPTGEQLAADATGASDVEQVKTATSNQLHPNLVKALIGVSVELARAEGIVGEDAVVNRANEIFNDASLDEPQTDAGKQAKTMAQVNLTESAKRAADAGGDNNPNMKPVEFDYAKLRDTTSIPACADILTIMGELAKDLPIPQKPTPEQEKAAEAAYEKLSLATFDILDKHGIGMSEYKFIFDSAKAVISALEDYTMQQVVGHRHEINSREFGVKNPGTGKFDANYATYGALKARLEKSRKDSGGNLDDYFNRTLADSAKGME